MVCSRYTLGVGKRDKYTEEKAEKKKKRLAARYNSFMSNRFYAGRSGMRGTFFFPTHGLYRDPRFRGGLKMIQGIIGSVAGARRRDDVDGGDARKSLRSGAVTHWLLAYRRLDSPS
jgi:hypothetical protein